MYSLSVRRIPRSALVAGLLLLTYFAVWFTDSIWEYIPESRPTSPTQVSSTPVPSPSFECQTYWNAAGDAESSCEPVDVEDPGWQGR